MAVKVAVTLCMAVILTVHVPVPEQSSLQPAKVEPVPAEAVGETEVPLSYVPAPVTVPEPVPALVTARA
ncbi:hypothetical protein EXS57_03360 [Candidatus Kaiserbacteria bacterium]|nr:hypothetical protein [Candidatus Kaiserbacteria bacterium]